MNKLNFMVITLRIKNKNESLDLYPTHFNSEQNKLYHQILK